MRQRKVDGAETDGSVSALASMRDISKILPRVSVIVPTLNEAENLPYVLPRIPHDVKEVLVVDGNSTDETVTLAPKLHPKVRIVYQKRKGKGEALRCGFEEATGDYIVTIDADGSMRPEEFPNFILPLTDGFEVTKGSRMMQGGGSADMDGLRVFGNRALARIANLLCGTHYTDVTYGYNAFRRECLTGISFHGEGFTIETEMALRFQKAGYKVKEIPSQEDARLYGQAKLNTVRDGWNILWTIIVESFHGKNGYHRE